MSPDVRIGYLVDHPEALPTLERLFESEWTTYYGTAGPGDAHRDLVAYSNRDQLPVGLVAFLGSEPCGVAALKADSISTHKHLTPWIGGGMVAPQFRRHGIGARLVSALEDVARNLGFTTVYSGTSTANSLLIREGWQLMEVVQYDGEAVSVYEKALSHPGGMTMSNHHIFAMKFAKVYPLYVQKAERKNRTKEEVDQIICWLTGYDQAGLEQQIEQENNFETFFAQAPEIHPNTSLIKGVVCGVRVEEIEDPLMQKVRYLDKLIDELAKGKAMEKILRQ